MMHQDEDWPKCKHPKPISRKKRMAREQKRKKKPKTTDTGQVLWKWLRVRINPKMGQKQAKDK